MPFPWTYKEITHFARAQTGVSYPGLERVPAQQLTPPLLQLLSRLLNHRVCPLTPSPSRENSTGTRGHCPLRALGILGRRERVQREKNR